MRRDRNLMSADVIWAHKISFIMDPEVCHSKLESKDLKRLDKTNYFRSGHINCLVIVSVDWKINIAGDYRLLNIMKK